MGLGHDGLAKLIAKEAEIELEKLQKGDLVLCLNTRGDKLKMIGGKGRVLAYLKMPHGQRIMKDALQFIPDTFGGRGFDYDAAVTKVLEVRLRPTMGRVAKGPEEARAKAQAGV